LWAKYITENGFASARDILVQLTRHRATYLSKLAAVTTIRLRAVKAKRPDDSKSIGKKGVDVKDVETLISNRRNPIEEFIGEILTTDSSFEGALCSFRTTKIDSIDIDRKLSRDAFEKEIWTAYKAGRLPYYEQTITSRPIPSGPSLNVDITNSATALRASPTSGMEVGEGSASQISIPKKNNFFLFAGKKYDNRKFLLETVTSHGKEIQRVVDRVAAGAVPRNPNKTKAESKIINDPASGYDDHGY
jgi:hypothetical protein